MSTWAIIPVKTLNHAKSRLAPFISDNERTELVRCLLHRLLQVLREVPRIDELLVVSRDPDVAQIAVQYEACVVMEENGAGLNQSVTIGKQVAAAQGADWVLMLPSDLPIVQPDDIEGLWGKTAVFPQPHIVICSDRHHQGTNALLMPAKTPFHFKYGHHSYAKHCEEARRLQLNVLSVDIPGLQFDLDTIQDWEIFQASETVFSINSLCQ